MRREAPGMRGVLRKALWAEATEKEVKKEWAQPRNPRGESVDAALGAWETANVFPYCWSGSRLLVAGWRRTWLLSADPSTLLSYTPPALTPAPPRGGVAIGNPD